MERQSAGDFQPGDGPYTVSTVLADYFKAREAHGDKSVDNDRTKADALIVPELGSMEVGKLTKNKISRWFAELAAAAPRVRTGKGKTPRFKLDESHSSVSILLLKAVMYGISAPGAVGADLPFISPIYWDSKGILGGSSAMRHSPSSLCRIQKSPTTGPSPLFTWGIGIAIIASVPLPLSGERSALVEE